MRIEASTKIGRPVAIVWDFYAVHHVENHPRWDPTIELENTSDGPVGVGTVIERRVDRFGDVIEGTMEITEFEPEAVMRVVIQDGPMRIDGWALFVPVGDRETRLTIGAELPGVSGAKGEQIEKMMAHSAATIKALIESETPGPG